MLIKNSKKRGESVVTSLGEIQFNEEGIAEVDEGIAQRLISLKGYEIVDEQPSDCEQPPISGQLPGSEQPNGNEQLPGNDLPTITEQPNGGGLSNSGEQLPSIENETQLQLPQNGNDGNGPVTQPNISIDSMTVEQLKQYAKDFNIDIKGLTKKPEILAVIIGSVAGSAQS